MPNVNVALTFILFTCLFTFTAATPILLSIFYETLCPDSIRFITRQFYPVYVSLGGYGNEFLAVEFLPYGKARTHQNENGTYEFQCQHGPAECSGNIVHACALANFGNDTRVPFVDCSMSSSSPPDAGPYCSQKLGLDFSPVESCVGTQGPGLLAHLGNVTLSLAPPLNFVPWLLYDNVFSQEDLDQSQVDFLGVLCRKLGNSTLPPICSTQGASTQTPN